jgi:nucleoside-diphosphate-sugar epimerase
LLARRKRILVTGGAGFLGSHLCEQLVSAGNEVLCDDNFYTGTRENLAGLLACHQFEVIRHDITFPLYVEVDEIFNLASPASPIHYQYDVVGPMNLGNHAEITMLELAELVIEFTGSRSAIEFKPLPIDDPKQRQSNIKLARDTLGWAPSVSLRDGLDKTIAYFETLMTAQRPGATR